MSRQLPDIRLSQAIAWIWLGFIVAGAVAWLGYRYWRWRHPPQAPLPETSYSERLRQRLAKSQGAAKHKRRDDPKGRQHRH
jgi:hypothetical protein